MNHMTHTSEAAAATAGLRDDILRHLTYSLGKDPAHAVTFDWRMALSLSVRDQIVERWFQSTRKTYAEQAKRVYYLSMEFLIGRMLQDAIVNLRPPPVSSEDILAKLENLNPGYSKKDRIARQIVEDALADGSLKPGQTVVEMSIRVCCRSLA